MPCWCLMPRFTFPSLPKNDRPSTRIPRAGTLCCRSPSQRQGLVLQRQRRDLSCHGEHQCFKSLLGPPKDAWDWAGCVLFPWGLGASTSASLPLRKKMSEAQQQMLLHLRMNASMRCRGFLILEQRGRGQVLATTHELNALNARLRDAAADAIMLTQQVRSQGVCHERSYGTLVVPPINCRCTQGRD